MVQKCGKQRVYCWIDGIDECKEDSLQHFLKKIRQFFGRNVDGKSQSNKRASVYDPEDSKSSTGQSSLRMIIVSREAPACLMEELAVFPRLRFAQDPGTKNTKDLQTYISAKAKEVSRVTGGSTTTEQLVADTLQESGDGTFLWVDVATQKLKKSTSGDIHQQLEQLPSSLDEILIRSLINIPPGWVTSVQALLKWVLLALRPLTLEEIRAAIGLSLDAEITYRQLETTISLCGGILSTHQQEVVLAHQSIRAFFLDLKANPSEHPRLKAFHFDETLLHAELTNMCILYLERGALNMQKGMKTLRKVLQLSDCVRVAAADGSTMSEAEINHNAQFPLLKYIVVNWPRHACLGDSLRINYETRFFAPDSSIRDTWWRSYYVSTKAKMAWKIAAPTPFTLLHIAAYFGIISLARHIESQGRLWKAMQARDGCAILPIQYAIYAGHSDFAYYLIERGAAKIPRDSFAQYDESVLEMAVVGGDLRIVNYLLNHGQAADAKTTAVMSCSDLGKVAWGYTRHYRYWKMWLSESDVGIHLFNADRSFKCSDGCFLIHQAAILGNVPMVQTLLAAGAKPNSQSSKAWRPIHDAAWFGYHTIIEALVNGGADIEAKNTTGYTALHCAAHEGQIECLRMLIDYGIHLEERTKKGRTALHTASRYGRTAAIDILLGAGSEIEATDNDGWTPLLSAIKKDKKEIVECLLVRGASTEGATINGPNGPYVVTPVEAVGEGKKTEMLQLLDFFARDADEFIRSSVFSQTSSEQLYLTGPEEASTTETQQQEIPFQTSSSPPRVGSVSSPPHPYIPYSPNGSVADQDRKVKAESYISVTPPLQNPSATGLLGCGYSISSPPADGYQLPSAPMSSAPPQFADHSSGVSPQPMNFAAPPTAPQGVLPGRPYTPAPAQHNATYPPLANHPLSQNFPAPDSNLQAPVSFPSRPISPTVPALVHPTAYQHQSSYTSPIINQYQPSYPPPITHQQQPSYPPPSPSPSLAYSPVQYNVPTPPQSAPTLSQPVAQNAYFQQPRLQSQGFPSPTPGQTFPPPPPVPPMTPLSYTSSPGPVNQQWLSPTNLSPPSAINGSGGGYFAPPPTQQLPQQQQVKKSKSFMDLSIRGRKLL